MSSYELLQQRIGKLPYIGKIVDSLEDRAVMVNDLAHEYLGSSIEDFGKRFPSFIKGSVIQSTACFIPPTEYEHTGGPAVMFIPGLFCMPSVFNKLGKELQSYGYDIYLPKPFPLGYGFLANTCRLEKSAHMLLDDLIALKKDGVTSISLIGHSLGGLIIVDTIDLAHNQGADIPKIEKIITISSPLKGAPIAKLFKYIVPACKDMDPDSETIMHIISKSDVIDEVIVSGNDSLVPEPNQKPSDVHSSYLAEFQHMDFYVGDDEKVMKTAQLLNKLLPSKKPIRKGKK